MGIFKNMFNSREEEIHSDWKRLEEMGQLNQIDKDSENKPIVLLKHSTSCGISAMIKYQLEKDWDFKPAEIDFYYLDLLAFRSISNQIAERYNVIHQSPQIIVIKNGRAVYNTSHHMISINNLKNNLTA